MPTPDSLVPSAPPPSFRPPLDGERLADRARNRDTIATYVEVLAKTSSTNDVCHEAAQLGAAEGLVVLAEEQESGRGQHGRQWNAPPRSSLLFSLLLRPTPELSQPAFLIAWAACAIAETLQREYGIDAHIKWPNDIVVAGRKFCGILTERRQATVVGIGLNVSIRPHEFPEELRMPAISLEDLWGQPIERTDFANLLLDELDALYVQAQSTNPTIIDQQWQSFAEPLVGKRVVVVTRSGERSGTLEHLSPMRGAVLRPENAAAKQQREEIAAENILRVTAATE